MASIFKRGRDKANRNSCYWIAYTDSKGRRRTKKGFADKRLSEQLAAKLEEEVRLVRAGLQREPNLLEPSKADIEGYLGDYGASLATRGVTKKHIQLALSRIRKVVAGCGFRAIRDISPEAVEGYLGERRSTEDLGSRTFNHYVQTMDSFCRWLVVKRHLRTNPLLGMARLNAEADVRHKRRALSTDELSRVIQGARKSEKTVENYGGEMRARCYLFSYFTGLRRREMGSLTQDNFDLAHDPPILRLEAACSKHRRADVLPLHPQLLVELKQWLDELEPGERLFPGFEKKKAWLMVKKDLERVGIAYRNEQGVADFHAAGRHSYITGLVRSGAKLADARELARHRDIRMTMRYTHIGLDDQAAALSALPDIVGQHLGSAPDVESCPLPSSGGTSSPLGERMIDTANPDLHWTYDATCQPTTVADVRAKLAQKAEGTGFEPATPCGAPEFQSGC